MYFITGLEKIEKDEQGWMDTGAIRTFGYFADLEIAKEAVINNTMDMFECLYKYIVIEEIKEGIYSICRNRWLYHFNATKGNYEPIEEFECMNKYCNFAIG